MGEFGKEIKGKFINWVIGPRREHLWVLMAEAQVVLAPFAGEVWERCWGGTLGGALRLALHDYLPVLPEQLHEFLIGPAYSYSRNYCEREKERERERERT